MAETLEIDLIEYIPEDNISTFSNVSIFNLTIRCIEINGKLNQEIGSFHLNKLSSLFKAFQKIFSLTHNRRHIKLIIDSKAVGFDIGIIGLIAFFKNKFLNVTFEISLSSNNESFFRFRDVLYALNNWNVELLGTNLYIITRNGKIVQPSNNEPTRAFPIFKINPETFSNYFIKTNNEWNIEKLLNPIHIEKLQYSIESLYSIHYATEATINEKNYRLLKDLIDEYKAAIQWENNNNIIFKHYVRMLCHFDIATDQIKNISDLSKLPIKKHKKYGLNNKEMAKLKKEMITILTQLNQQPIFFNFLFSILSVRNLERKVGNYDVYVMSISELYAFTQNMFLGIREIARNIVEHTVSREGIISFRIYTAESIHNLKTTETHYELNNYITEKDRENNKDYLDIIVFDEGEDGIITKTIENVKAISQSLNSDKTQLHIDDIAKLENGETNLKDFYNLNGFKLNYHAVKASSHWGLIIFTNLINKNRGFVKVTTNSYERPFNKESCINYLDKLEHIPEVKNPFSIGTFYNLVLPLDEKINFRVPTIGYNVPKVVEFSTMNHIELLKYKVAKSVDEIYNDGAYYILHINILDHIKLNTTETYRGEFEVAKSIANSFFNTQHSLNTKSKFIPVLDFEGCEDRFEQSKLIRLLGGLQLFYDFTSLIIINIRTNEIVNLSDTLSLKGVSGNKGFWNSDHFILIYSHDEKEGKRRYQTDIIGGNTYNDWNILRNKLHSTHLTYYNIPFEIQDNEDGLTQETSKSIRSSPLFIGHNNAIQNFELILKHGNKNLYEYAIEYILDKKISNQDTDSNREETGYRITDSHFKLGSKIHIKDFIYAKRLFQIGYYTNKFAFQVAQYILRNLKDGKYALKGDKSLTLIGYAEYSQMLVNRVERILGDKNIKNEYGITRINHDLLNDVDSLSFIKKEEIGENIIIIVPVNTTFSTSIKIEVELRKALTKRFIDKYKENEKKPSDDEIKKYINNFNFFEPFINVILVSHDDLNDPIYVEKLNIYLAPNQKETEEYNFHYPYKVFKWRSVNPISKEITVATNELVDKDIFKERKQKYFLNVASKWYLPDTCVYCFPPKSGNRNSEENQSPEGDENKNWVEDDISIIYEKALLETDKTSVTPNLLLELPKSFETSKYQTYDENVFINESCHKYGHFIHMEHHYLHYIDAESFFDFYQNEIRIWAAKYKEKLSKKHPTIFQKSVLLISPSERNNTYFLEFVNRYIFDDSTSIIHYEVKGDYVENYQKFFKEIITTSDFIFYVDDFIKSGNTFHRVNDFVKYCNREYSEKGNKSCNGIISLISKADNFSKRDIISLLRGEEDNDYDELKYICFHELNVYNIDTGNCPLCSEQKRYRELADNSMLDTVRHYFLNKVNKLRTQGIKTENDNKNGQNDWGKYHPLVKDSLPEPLPWSDTATNEVKELYATFISDTLPGKKYLKLLIEHKLNHLLSNDTNIRERITSTEFINLDGEDSIRKNKELLVHIIEKLKKENPFSRWMAGYNNATQEVFNKIFDELVLKVFTLQPFINIKPIREKVFAWILIELHEHLNTLVKSTTFNFISFRRLKFLLRRATLLGSNYAIRTQTLRKLQEIFIKYSKEEKHERQKKRLEKYNAVKEELEKLKIEQQSIQNQINTYLESDNQKQKTLFVSKELSDLKEELNEYKNRIAFTKQVIRNIEYKDSSLNEFNYFYVSLIKELLIGNESKVIKLEENVSDILQSLDIEKEKDFYYLLKLIQYENAIIIKQGLNLIVREYIHAEKYITFNDKFSKKEVRKSLIEGFKKSMGDTRLSSFRKFIGFKDFDTWQSGTDENTACTRESFYHYLHLLYLLTVFSNEENNSKSEVTALENKTKTVLQNLFRVACDPNFSKHNIKDDEDIKYQDDFHSGAFIALKFRTESERYTKPEELFVAYATKTKPENAKDNSSLLEIEVDEESLSYFMINGLCKKGVIDSNYESYKPRTILEFKKTKSNGWQPVMSGLFPVNSDLAKDFSKIYENGEVKDSFTENLFNESLNFSNYCLLRIAKLDIVNNRVLNKGNAVITFFSKNENGLDIQRLRLLMIAKDYLQKFIEEHYESDSITAFVNERIKLKEYEKLSHGFKKYLTNLSKVAHDINNIKDQEQREDREQLIEVLYNIIKTGPILHSLIEPLEKKRADDNNSENYNFDNDLEVDEKCISDIVDDTAKLINVIIKNKVAETSPIRNNEGNKCFNSLIHYQENVKIMYSKFIFHSIISEIVINAKKYRSDTNSFELKLSVTQDNNDNSLFWFEFSNTFRKGSMTEKKIMKLNKKNIRFSTNGLSLIKRLSFASTGTYPFINCNISTLDFSIKIPLKSLKK